MGICCGKKTLIGNMRWRAPDQEVDQRRHGERLCQKIAKQARNLNREDAVDRSRWKKLIKIG